MSLNLFFSFYFFFYFTFPLSFLSLIFYLKKIKYNHKVWSYVILIHDKLIYLEVIYYKLNLYIARSYVITIHNYKNTNIFFSIIYYCKIISRCLLLKKKMIMIKACMIGYSCKKFLFFFFRF